MNSAAPTGDRGYHADLHWLLFRYRMTNYRWTWLTSIEQSSRQAGTKALSSVSLSETIHFLLLIMPHTIGFMPFQPCSNIGHLSHRIGSVQALTSHPTNLPVNARLTRSRRWVSRPFTNTTSPGRS